MGGCWRMFEFAGRGFFWIVRGKGCGMAIHSD